MPSFDSFDAQRGIGLRLPPVLTSFFGREAEIDAGYALLTASDVRLLTLTGPGGVGKTRLSLAIATRAQAAFSDGVVFVPLAAIRDHTLVIPTILKRIDLPDRIPWANHSGLARFFQGRRMLLILDNFEQVVPAASDIARLLDACPELRVVVTSRIPLNIDGERLFPVDPLPVEHTGQPGAALDEQLAVVSLFIERARAANPALAIGDDDIPIITDICRQLDGLPLAIELAAVHCRSLTPVEVLERLDRRLPLLGSDGQTRPAHQRTIRDTIAWSYDLLSPDDQRLFRRLGVFIGGFSRETADVLSRDLGFSSIAAIDSLIEQNLVRQVIRPGIPTRLRLLETIREFAWEQLDGAGELDDAIQWHSDHFAGMAGEAVSHLLGRDQVGWLDGLEREHDNLRTALEWAIATRDVNIGLTICSGIWRFWERRGHVGEGRLLIERMFGVAGSTEPTLAYAGALFGLGRLRYVQGDFESSRAAFRTLIDVCRELNSDYWLAGAYTQLSHLATVESNYEEARDLAEKGLALRRQVGDIWGTAVSFLVLGRNAHYLGDGDRANQLTEEAISIFRGLGDRTGMSDGFTELGEFALQRGKIALARGHFEEALALRQELGDELATADLLALLGYVAIGQRNYRGARSLFRRSMTSLVDLGASWKIDPALEGLAAVALATGDPVRAVRILAAADRMRTELRAFLSPDARERHEHTLDAARASLDTNAFADAWSAGSVLTIDQAREEALGVGIPQR